MNILRDHLDREIVVSDFGWDNYFMRLAIEASYKSKDPSTKFGCVVVNDNRVLSIGMNGLPQGVYDYRYRLYTEEKYKWVVHSESNAIANAARYGIALKNSTLYIMAWPCSSCSSLIVSAGIKRVVMHKKCSEIFAKDFKWDNTISEIMFSEAGIEIMYIEDFLDKKVMIKGEWITI